MPKKRAGKPATPRKKRKPAASSRVGRPREYSNEEMVAALEQSDGLVYITAQKLGCQPATIYARAKQCPEIKEAIKNCRGKIIDDAEQRLREAVNKKAPWAIAMVLRTLGRKRGYVERSETKHSGKIKSVPVVSEQGKLLDKLSTETKKRVLAELQAARKAAEATQTATPPSDNNTSER